MEIGWIDFSDEERNLVLQTLALLGEETAVDELGIASVRNYFSDKLFPGISTLQTKAKYFILIPHIFRKAEEQNYNIVSDVSNWINKYEDKLINSLLKGSSEDADGIIGKRNKTVKKKPSSIYWNGLKTFEIIRKENLSFKNACRITYDNSKKNKNLQKNNDEDGHDDENLQSGNNIIFTYPNIDYDIDKEVNIELTKLEAEFLFQKITSAYKSKNSMLAFFLKKKLDYENFFMIDENVLPEDIKKYYILAKNFSEFIYGAYIRYNLIYSGYDKEIDLKFKEWKNSFNFSSLSLQEIFSDIYGQNLTKEFCESFLKYVEEEDVEAMDKLIINREKFIKGDRSKLMKPEEYKYDSNKGIYEIDYRYRKAKRIINDIIRGLEVE